VSVTWVWAAAQSAHASSNRKITRRFMVPSLTWESRVKTIFADDAGNAVARSGERA
jgi:hypothetical protein